MEQEDIQWGRKPGSLSQAGYAYVLSNIWNIPGGSVQETQVQSLGWEDCSSGERNGYLLYYSCLENSVDREAYWAAVHRSQRIGHD